MAGFFLDSLNNTLEKVLRTCIILVIGAANSKLLNPKRMIQMATFSKNQKVSVNLNNNDSYIGRVISFDPAANSDDQEGYLVETLCGNKVFAMDSGMKAVSDADFKLWEELFVG